MERYSRRRLLRAGGAAGVVGLSASAGCLGFLGGDGSEQGTTTEGTTPPETTDTTTEGSESQRESYLKWLPAPGAANVEADPGYTHLYNHVGHFRDHREELHKTTYNRAVRAVGTVRNTVGVDPRSVDRVVQVGTSGVRIATGEFDPDAIAAELEERKFASNEPHRGHELYVQLGEEARAVAFDETSVLICRRWGPNEPVAVARSMLDTYHGEQDRYFAENADFRAAVDPVQDASRAGAQLIEPPEESDPAAGRFAGNTAFGYGFTVGEGTSELLFSVVFGDEGDADPDAVRTWAEEGLDALDQYESYEVRRNGRRVELAGTIATGRLDFLADGDPDEDGLD